MFKKLFNWLYVILWMSVIFYFSNQPDLKSNLPTFWDLVFRKIAHASEYFVLAYLFFRALKEHGLQFYYVIFLSFIGALSYAVSDEFHQTFIHGRSGNIIDISIDGIGIIIFVILIVLNKEKYYHENSYNK